MRTVDLIQRKRAAEELSPEEMAFLINGYTSGEIPDYQMSAYLMATFFTGMTDREVSSFTDCMIQSGTTIDLSGISGPKVDKHSTGGVGDKTSLITGPIAAAAGVIVPMMSGRALGHTGGTLDKLESIPGFQTAMSQEQFQAQLSQHGLAFIGQSDEVTPADKKIYALRDVTGTVESIPLIASSIMSKKVAEGIDGLVLDVKVGSGAFMKKQVDARKLAQMMVGIGRRLDKKVQALITDMNQPLGYAIGNALEVMEVSQTLHNEGPEDLRKLSLELAARMIFVAKITKTLEEARELAEKKLSDGSAYKKFCQVVEAQGGNANALEKFELLPNATGMREITTQRAGFVSAIDAEYIGRASTMMGAGRDRKEDAVDHAVGVILEVKTGEKVDAGAVLCRLYYTQDNTLEEAAELVEDAFKISSNKPNERELILEVVG